MGMKLTYNKPPVSDSDKQKIHEMCEMVRLRCDIKTQELREERIRRHKELSDRFNKLEGSHKQLKGHNWHGRNK